MWAATVPPVVFQCRLQNLEFLQWHSSVGLFQLSFSSGVPVYPASIWLVAQWYPSVHWVNQWHSNSIPVYTGPASVHWLRVRVISIAHGTTRIHAIPIWSDSIAVPWINLPVLAIVEDTRLHNLPTEIIGKTAMVLNNYISTTWYDLCGTSYFIDKTSIDFKSTIQFKNIKRKQWQKYTEQNTI